jgi:hypothetical protein
MVFLGAVIFLYLNLFLLLYCIKLRIKIYFLIGLDDQKLVSDM